MKKIICMMLAVAMVVSLVACAKTKENTETPETPEVTEDPAKNETTEENEGDQAENETPPSEEAPHVVDALAEKFEGFANEDMTAEEIAGRLAQAEFIPFTTMVEKMESRELAGFNEEVGEFEECYVMAPLIGSIPFVSYVFELGENEDVNAFAENLEKIANLSWNICVTADEMKTSIVGDKVFFVMSPMYFGTAETTEDETPVEGEMTEVSDIDANVETLEIEPEVGSETGDEVED